MNKAWKTINPRKYKDINQCIKSLKEKNIMLVFGLKILLKTKKIKYT